MTNWAKKPVEKQEGPYKVEGFEMIDSEIEVTQANCREVGDQLGAYAVARVRDLVMQFRDTPKEGTMILLAMEVARKQRVMEREEQKSRLLGVRAPEEKADVDAGSEPGGEVDSACEGLSPAFGEALRAAVPDDDAGADRGPAEATD